MSDTGKTYISEEIDVSFDAARCIHAAECVRGLPAVFDTAARPWIQPAGAPADAIVTIVERCPSGALHYTRKDGAAEQPDAANTVTVRANGPLYVRGDVTLRTDAGELRLTDTRMALCRCGQSKNKPFCDNSHREAGFSDAGAVKEKAVEGFAPGGPLTITATPNGSLQVEGAVEVIGAGGVEQAQATKTWLCRCGGSANKPFCDGTHKRNGFQG
jgi:CDGSH-type Zn-finger protein/uncharacterized Fe-S cluster protein YjdI